MKLSLNRFCSHRTYENEMEIFAEISFFHQLFTRFQSSLLNHLQKLQVHIALK
jgi:hypothetical protein